MSQYNAGMSQTSPQQRGWRWERTVTATLVLLVGGALMNVAVAWEAMLIDPPPHPMRSNYDRPRLEDPVAFLQRYFPDLDPAENTCGGNMYRGRGWRELVASCHSDPSAASVIASVLVHQAGWPLPAVQGRIEEYRGTTQRVGYISRTAATLTPLATRHEHLPYMPIWTGFIVNTLVYAALLWLLVAAPFTARRMIRRRRGLCEKCAYPVGVSPVCTECGAANSVVSHGANL